MGNALGFKKGHSAMESPPKKKMNSGGASTSGGDESTEVIDDSKPFVQRFAVLFNSSYFSDVKLKVGDQTYFGHKLILASASTVFGAMFGESPAWEESRQNEITLVEEEACQTVFYDFLKYFYSAKIDMTTDKALPLLFLADKYNVQSLRDSCVDYMMKHIEELPDKNKTLTWYHYSKMTGPKRLRKSCKDFIVSNFSVVLNAPDWPEMDIDELVEFLYMSELCVESEMTLYEKVEQWIMSDHNAEHRQENVETLLKCLRFEKLSPPQLLSLESSQLMENFPDLFKPVLSAAYRLHSLSSIGLLLPGEHEQFRNYTSSDYGLCFPFELKNFASIPKIESRICLPCQVPYHPCLDPDSCKNSRMAQFQVYFYPKGHFSTISLYGNFMGRQNDNVTLKIGRHSSGTMFDPSCPGGSTPKPYPPMAVQVTLQLYSKKKSLRFVALTRTDNHVFSKQSPELVVENVLDLSRLTAEDSVFIVEGSLSGAVFIKVQCVGNDKLEDGMVQVHHNSETEWD